jgi:hypothetical protein
MTTRHLPAPWRVEEMPGGYVVGDANGQALAYNYSRANEAEALQAKVLTDDEAWRIGGKKPPASAKVGDWICQIISFFGMRL